MTTSTKISPYHQGYLDSVAFSEAKAGRGTGHFTRMTTYPRGTQAHAAYITGLTDHTEDLMRPARTSRSFPKWRLI